jgi:autotransporter translocation and assembly factor TamB
MNKRFDVELGSAIELVGKVPDSQLQIRAVYNSRYGPLTVAVTNRLASPTIDFESAVFSDDADILSVLVTGKPLSELSTAEGTRTLSSVGATLAGFTAKTLGRFAPVDMLDVDFGNDVSSGSAEAGKALGSRVYLIVRFRWGTQDDKNTIEAQVEVQIARDLYFQVRMGDKVEGAGEIVWKSRF